MTIGNSSNMYRPEARKAGASSALQRRVKRPPAIVVFLDDFDTLEDV